MSEKRRGEDVFMDNLLDDLDPRSCDACFGTGHGVYRGWSQGYDDCEGCDGTGFKGEVTA
jgi:hypothetical protein